MYSFHILLLEHVYRIVFLIAFEPVIDHNILIYWVKITLDIQVVDYFFYFYVSGLPRSLTFKIEEAARAYFVKSTVSHFKKQ